MESDSNEQDLQNFAGKAIIGIVAVIVLASILFQAFNRPFAVDPWSSSYIGAAFSTLMWWLWRRNGVNEKLLHENQDLKTRNAELREEIDRLDNAMQYVQTLSQTKIRVHESVETIKQIEQKPVDVEAQAVELKCEPQVQMDSK